MADLPSDPEQLARQILTGRVSIEQLAQEQARRRAAGQSPSAIRPSPAPGQPKTPSSYAPPPARPATPTAGRTGYQPAVRVLRPEGKTVPFPARPASRVSGSGRGVPPSGGPSASPAGQPRRSAGDPRVVAAEGVRPAPGGAKPTAGSAKPKAGGATTASVKGPAGVGPNHPATPPGVIAVAMLKDHRYLRSSLILTEILGPPLALRDQAPVL